MHLAPGIEGMAKNRVLQFLVAGSVIFALTPRPESSRDIALTRENLGRLERAEASKRGNVGKGVVDERAIEDEVLYREGLRIGFDKNDSVVRQRLIQKVLFFAEELKGAADPPSEADLRSFYLDTRPTWKRSARHHFRLVFMKERAPLDALKRALDDGTIDRTRAFTMGDPCPVPREITASEDELARTLGAIFARELTLSYQARTLTSNETPRSHYQGPIPSAYGYHLIEAIDDVPAEIAPFEEVADRVREAYLVKRREDAVSEFLTDAFRRYRVTIDGERIESINPQRRLALRVEESGED
jgi:hypothetical protein